MASTTMGPSARILSGMRSTVEIGLLGLLWILAALPVITIVFSTNALFFSLRVRDQEGGENMLAAFLRGICVTAKSALRISAVSLPVLGLQAVTIGGLIVTGTPVATVLLGFAATLSALWLSFLLTFHATLALQDSATMPSVVRIALRQWALNPFRPLLAVALGATLVAVTWTGFIVAALFAASLPALLVYSRNPARPTHGDEEA